MPNDAKLGLILGVGVVVVVAVVFFRKDPAFVAASGERAAMTSDAAAPEPTKPVPVQPTARTKPKEERTHTVQEGDTLFSLAEHYYGDKARFVEIYRANTTTLKTPDELPAGIVLVIPTAETP